MEFVMGIDLLDLNLRIEEAFGVYLEPRAWQDMFADSSDAKVEQLYSLILERRRMADVLRLDLAINESFWKEFQAGVAAVRNCPVDDIQLSASIESVFPPGTRRADLLALEEEITHLIPVLHQGHDIMTELGLIICGLWFAGIAAWEDAWHVSTIVLGFTAIAVPCTAVFRRWRSSTREERWLGSMQTIKELVRRVRDWNFRNIAELMPTKTDAQVDDIWDQLCEVLIDSLGLDDGEVTRDAWLIKDLGCE